MSHDEQGDLQTTRFPGGIWGCALNGENPWVFTSLQDVENFQDRGFRCVQITEDEVQPFRNDPASFLEGQPLAEVCPEGSVWNPLTTRCEKVPTAEPIDFKPPDVVCKPGLVWDQSQGKCVSPGGVEIDPGLDDLLDRLRLWFAGLTTGRLNRDVVASDDPNLGRSLSELIARFKADEGTGSEGFSLEAIPKPVLIGGAVIAAILILK